MTASVVRNTAKPLVGERDHLIVPHVRGKRPRTQEHNRRARAPVLEKEALPIARSYIRARDAAALAPTLSFERSRGGCGEHPGGRRCRERRPENISSLHAKPPTLESMQFRRAAITSDVSADRQRRLSHAGIQCRRGQTRDN